MPVKFRARRRQARIEVITTELLAASVDKNIYIAARPCKVQSVQFATTVVGGASAAVILKACTGTTAPASGTAMTSSMDLQNTVVNTVTTATLTESATYLKEGDRIGADFSGTLTGLVGVLQVIIETY
jgi:hypothetical protein